MRLEDIITMKQAKAFDINIEKSEHHLRLAFDSLPNFFSETKIELLKTIYYLERIKSLSKALEQGRMPINERAEAEGVLKFDHQNGLNY